MTRLDQLTAQIDIISAELASVEEQLSQATAGMRTYLPGWPERARAARQVKLSQLAILKREKLHIERRITGPEDGQAWRGFLETACFEMLTVSDFEAVVGRAKQLAASVGG